MACRSLERRRWGVRHFCVALFVWGLSGAPLLQGCTSDSPEAVASGRLSGRNRPYGFLGELRLRVAGSSPSSRVCCEQGYTPSLGCRPPSVCRRQPLLLGPSASALCAFFEIPAARGRPLLFCKKPADVSSGGPPEGGPEGAPEGAPEGPPASLRGVCVSVTPLLSVPEMWNKLPRELLGLFAAGPPSAWGPPGAPWGTGWGTGSA